MSMSQKQIWRTSSPRYSQCLPWPRSRGCHPGSPAVNLIVALLLLLALPSAGVVCAEGSIRVRSQTVGHVFSESLTFALEVESETPMIEAVLFFGEQGERLVRRVYPAVSPGTSLRVRYVESLESGQLAPGTMLRAWWQLRMADGSLAQTEPSLFEYTDDNHEWSLMAGKRVDLLSYGQSSEETAALLASAEGILTRLEDQVGVAVENRVRIYSYESAADMGQALSQRSEGYDDRVMTLGVSVGNETLLILSAHRDVDVIMAHELAHIVVGLATENPFSDLPRWLDEGLAMYSEAEVPADNLAALDRAIRRDELLSVRSMSSYPGQARLVDLFYGEVYSVVKFLLDAYGRERMNALLGEFSEGMRQEEALLSTYGFGLDELDAQWRTSLGLEPRLELVAGPDQPEANRSPTEESRPLCASAVGAAMLPLFAVVIRRQPTGDAR